VREKVRSEDIGNCGLRNEGISDCGMGLRNFRWRCVLPTHSHVGRRLAAAGLWEVSPCGLGTGSVVRAQPPHSRVGFEEVSPFGLGISAGGVRAWPPHSRVWIEEVSPFGLGSDPFTLYSSPFTLQCRPAGLGLDLWCARSPHTHVWGLRKCRPAGWGRNQFAFICSNAGTARRAPTSIIPQSEIPQSAIRDPQS